MGRRSLGGSRLARPSCVRPRLTAGQDQVDVRMTNAECRIAGRGNRGGPQTRFREQLRRFADPGGANNLNTEMRRSEMKALNRSLRLTTKYRATMKKFTNL